MRVALYARLSTQRQAQAQTVEQIKEDGDLWRRSRQRHIKYLNNSVEMA